jgi:DNA phosphorothioation-associated putative methyltransferase
MCPVELRIYIGCATQLYGELDTVSLIKAHILSGKVSLMVYDDWEKDTPLLTERIKIRLRDQDIDFFDYVGDYEPQPLINKDAFL